MSVAHPSEVVVIYLVRVHCAPSRTFPFITFFCTVGFLQVLSGKMISRLCTRRARQNREQHCHIRVAKLRPLGCHILSTVRHSHAPHALWMGAIVNAVALAENQ